MQWYQEDEYEDEEEDLMFSPALLARRASESWIVAPPVEVYIIFDACNAFISCRNAFHPNKNQITKQTKYVKTINQFQIKTNFI